MIKLKDILSESKVGYLVERPRKKGKKKRAQVIGKKSKKQPKKSKKNPILTKKYDLISKATGKPVERTGQQVLDKGLEKGKQTYDKFPAVFNKIKKALEKDKKGKESQTKKDKENADIRKASVTVKRTTKVKGKEDKIDDIPININDVLPPPFGSAKELDDDKEGTEEAKQYVYDKKLEIKKKEAKKEVKARKKKSKGEFKLTKNEQKSYDKYKKSMGYANETEEEWFTTDKVEDDVAYLDPDDGSQWEEKTGTGSSDYDSDIFGMVDSDEYGNPLADERGGDTQQDALATKLKIDKKNLFKPKDSEKVITNAHGQKIGVTVLKNKKDGKFYAVDDEGIVYKSKTGKFDSEEDYEPEFDLGGFPGAQTQKGLNRIDNRKPDEYGMADEVSFEDLLDLLGLDEF